MSTLFSFKLPAGMLSIWREVAAKRGIPVAQLIREAVNKDIDANEGRAKP